jgi:transcriptional regulator with XRE-family HTH domain
MRRTPDDFDKKFGTALRLARVKRGLSQVELGAALGVRFQQIQKYEIGTNHTHSWSMPDAQNQSR